MGKKLCAYAFFLIACIGANAAAAQQMGQATCRVFFKPGSARPDAQALTSLRNMLARTPKDSLRHIYITGHTDTLGNDSINTCLAELRAREVLRVLCRQGLPLRLMHVNFVAKPPQNAAPAPAPATLASQAEWRRVDVKLMWLKPDVFASRASLWQQLAPQPIQINVPAQVASIFKLPNGVVLAFAAGAAPQATPVQVWGGATAANMLLAQMPTVSNGMALASNGAYGLGLPPTANAPINGMLLVPVREKQPAMQAFTAGPRKGAQALSWKQASPQPLQTMTGAELFDAFVMLPMSRAESQHIHELSLTKKGRRQLSSRYLFGHLLRKPIPIPERTPYSTHVDSLKNLMLTTYGAYDFAKLARTLMFRQRYYVVNLVAAAQSEDLKAKYWPPTTWVNCDRYLNEPNMVPLVLEGPVPDSAIVSLVLSSYNTVLPAALQAGRVEFAAVPPKTPGRLVAMAIKNGKPYVAVQCFTTGNMTRLNLQWRPMPSIAAMKAYVEVALK